MDILIKSLENDNFAEKINYRQLVFDLHESKDKRRGQYITYVTYGVVNGILILDRLFYTSVMNIGTVEHCFVPGICIRMGADIHRFYKGKSITGHIIDEYGNDNEEVFTFLMVMLLLNGVTYNDHIYESGSTMVHNYFASKNIGIFFPKNIILENQKLLNLCVDKIIDEKKYQIFVNDVIGNLDLNLISEKHIPSIVINGEDKLVAEIIDACNFNMFREAYNATYKVTYFSMERICINIARYTDNRILVEQLIQMLKFLEHKNILIDETQYGYIRRVCKDIQHMKMNDIDAYVITLLKENNKTVSLEGLKRIHIYPSYLNYTTAFKNTYYKAVYNKIKEIGEENTLALL